MNTPITTAAVAEPWLAASYHMPTTYSCRTPMSSMSSATALPAPGPATVRLALVRTAIELCGTAYTRDALFPAICRADIRIQPPGRVALSTQAILAYKESEWLSGDVAKRDERTSLTTAPICREYAQAGDPLTIYIAMPDAYHDIVRQLFMAVGYWGQGHSLASCVAIQRQEPVEGECARPLVAMADSSGLHGFVTSLCTEFRDATVSWHAIMPTRSTAAEHAFRIDVYVWPLIVAWRHASGTLLVRRPLPREDRHGSAGADAPST